MKRGNHGVRLANTVGILLAGGASRRFGRDKRFARVEGQTLLERALHRMRVFPRVVVLTEPGGRRALTPVERDAACWEVIEDPHPYPGPVRALARALEVLGFPPAVVFPVDMPWFPVAVLRDLARATGSSASKGVHRGRVWIVATPSSPLPLAMDARAGRSFASFVRGGGRSFQAWLDLGEVDVRSLGLSLPPEAWINVNRPEDLRCPKC